jgi:hypothetical protein
MLCRDDGRDAVDDDDEFTRSVLTGERGSAGIIRGRRMTGPVTKDKGSDTKSCWPNACNREKPIRVLPN